AGVTVCPEPAERGDVRGRQRAGRKLPRRCPRVASVDLGIDEAVEAHRERPRAAHCDRDPGHRPEPGPAVDGEKGADVRERQREDRVPQSHETRQPDRERCGDRAQTGSFVLETSSTPSMRISLSIAFAMSYTVSAAT